MGSNTNNNNNNKTSSKSKKHHHHKDADDLAGGQTDEGAGDFVFTAEDDNQYLQLVEELAKADTRMQHFMHAGRGKNNKDGDDEDGEGEDGSGDDKKKRK